MTTCLPKIHLAVCLRFKNIFSVNYFQYIDVFPIIRFLRDSQINWHEFLNKDST